MNATAEYLPAFTEEQLALIAAKEAAKHSATISQFCKGDFEATQEHLADLAQSFALGACEAASKAKDGGAVRTFQWKYGTGFLLKRMHEILSEMIQDGKNKQIDHSGGACGNGDDNEPEESGYVVEGDGAIINDLAAEDARAEAAKAFESLPDDLRQVVQLRAIDDESFEKIGNILGIGKVMAYRKYTKGIEIMRRQFAA